MEKFIYEFKPYFFAVVSIYALMAAKGSILMSISGVILMLCCASIALLRHDHRTAPAYQKKSKLTRDELNGRNHLGQTRYHIG